MKTEFIIECERDNGTSYHDLKVILEGEPEEIIYTQKILLKAFGDKLR